MNVVNAIRTLWSSNDIEVHHWCTHMDSVALLHFTIINNSEMLQNVIIALKAKYSNNTQYDVKINNEEIKIENNHMEVGTKWFIYGPNFTHMGPDHNYEDTIRILSSYEKIGDKLNEIKKIFPQAVIVNIGDNCGYGVYSIKLGEVE